MDASPLMPPIVKTALLVMMIGNELRVFVTALNASGTIVKEVWYFQEGGVLL